MWDIVGQEKAVSFLRKSLERGSLAHAYLLVGPPHVGKMALAINLARQLTVNRLNVLVGNVFLPENRSWQTC